jgi:hypothetical protein
VKQLSRDQNTTAELVCTSLHELPLDQDCLGSKLKGSGNNYKSELKAENKSDQNVQIS